MVVVKAQPGDTSDSVIRKFTRKVLTEGILQDLKKKEFYVKPAERRKEQKKELAGNFDIRIVLNADMLLDSITTDIQQSLKKGDSVRVETLRFLVSAVKNAAINKYGAAAHESIKDEDVLDTIKKQVKTRRESIEAFSQAGRKELAEKEIKELEILQTFLPKELSDEELKAILSPLAKSEEKNFGLLMKQAMALVSGQADGGRVSKILKTLQ